VEQMASPSSHKGCETCIAAFGRDAGSPVWASQSALEPILQLAEREAPVERGSQEHFCEGSLPLPANGTTLQSVSTSLATTDVSAREQQYLPRRLQTHDTSQ